MVALGSAAHVYVFKDSESNSTIADIPTELPCLGDLENLLNRKAIWIFQRLRTW